LVRSGVIDPLLMLTSTSRSDVIEAYETFAHRGRGWINVKLEADALR
jgi:threonine dehydrogenase-like Zn-dependent dehydrogenase